MVKGRLSLMLLILVTGWQRRLVALFVLAILITVSEEIAVCILHARGTLITVYSTFFRLISTLGGLCRLQCVH